MSGAKRPYGSGSSWQEWTLAVDCEAEGCDPPHSDDGETARVWDHPANAPEQMTLNGHAAKLLTRVVTRTAWEPVANAGSDTKEKQ